MAIPDLKKVATSDDLLLTYRKNFESCSSLRDRQHLYNHYQEYICKALRLVRTAAVFEECSQVLERQHKLELSRADLLKDYRDTIEDDKKTVRALQKSDQKAYTALFLQRRRALMMCMWTEQSKYYGFQEFGNNATIELAALAKLNDWDWTATTLYVNVAMYRRHLSAQGGNRGIKISQHSSQSKNKDPKSPIETIDISRALEMKKKGSNPELPTGTELQRYGLIYDLYNLLISRNALAQQSPAVQTPISLQGMSHRANTPSVRNGRDHRSGSPSSRFSISLKHPGYLTPFTPANTQGEAENDSQRGRTLSRTGPSVTTPEVDSDDDRPWEFGRARVGGKQPKLTVPGTTSNDSTPNRSHALFRTDDSMDIDTSGESGRDEEDDAEQSDEDQSDKATVSSLNPKSPTPESFSHLSTPFRNDQQSTTFVNGSPSKEDAPAFHTVDSQKYGMNESLKSVSTDSYVSSNDSTTDTAYSTELPKGRSAQLATPASFTLPLEPGSVPLPSSSYRRFFELGGGTKDWLDDPIIYAMIVGVEKAMTSRDPSLPQFLVVDPLQIRSPNPSLNKFDPATHNGIAVPINSSSHWSLVLVLDLSKSCARIMPDSPWPSMIVLDSMCDGSSSMEIFMEWWRKLRGSLPQDFNIPDLTRPISQQINGSDCGLFTIAFFAAFRQDPYGSMRLLKNEGKDAWPALNPHTLRQDLFLYVSDLGTSETSNACDSNGLEIKFPIHEPERRSKDESMEKCVYEEATQTSSRLSVVDANDSMALEWLQPGISCLEYGQLHCIFADLDSKSLRQLRDDGFNTSSRLDRSTVFSICQAIEARLRSIGPRFCLVSQEQLDSSKPTLDAYDSKIHNGIVIIMNDGDLWCLAFIVNASDESSQIKACSGPTLITLTPSERTSPIQSRIVKWWNILAHFKSKKLGIKDLADHDRIVDQNGFATISAFDHFRRHPDQFIQSLINPDPERLQWLSSRMTASYQQSLKRCAVFAITKRGVESIQSTDDTKRHQLHQEWITGTKFANVLHLENEPYVKWDKVMEKLPDALYINQDQLDELAASDRPSPKCAVIVAGSDVDCGKEFDYVEMVKSKFRTTHQDSVVSVREPHSDVLTDMRGPDFAELLSKKPCGRNVLDCKPMVYTGYRDILKHPRFSFLQDLWSTAVGQSAELDFMTIGFPFAFSGAHVDVLCGTSIKFLQGHKAWHLVPNMNEADMRSFEKEGQSWNPKGKQRTVVLGDGEVLVMFAENFNVHSVSNSDDIVVMLGTFFWQADRMELTKKSLIRTCEHPKITNEPIPKALPKVLTAVKRLMPEIKWDEFRELGCQCQGPCQPQNCTCSLNDRPCRDWCKNHDESLTPRSKGNGSKRQKREHSYDCTADPLG